jgi:predicted transcriptional regulator
MTAKIRSVELDSETVARLESWAAERGLSVRQLLAELTLAENPLALDWESMRRKGRGPWAPEVLAEDARRLANFELGEEGVPWNEVEAWMRSWGRPEELPPPKPRKL